MLRTASPSLKPVVALAATWLMLAGPASMVGGLTAIEGLSYSAVLCVAPHLLIAAFAFQPQARPLAGLLVSMSLRLVVVLLGTVVICWHRPDLRGMTFVIWLVPCYFVALAVETRAMITKSSGPSEPDFVKATSVTGTTISG